MRLLTCFSAIMLLLLPACSPETSAESPAKIAYVRGAETTASTDAVADTMLPAYESMNDSWLGNDCVVNQPLGAQTASGAPITDLAVSDSILSGQEMGLAIQGADFKGVIMPAIVGSQAGKIQISDVNAEIGMTSYLIQFLPSTASKPDGPTTQWGDLCGEDESGKPIPAIPIYGFFDSNGSWQTPSSGSGIVITFACVNGAVGKCLKIGYLPWVNSHLHQACTRMLRADYCGDGNSHTITGTKVNISDKAGIHKYSSVPDWTKCCKKVNYFHEAAWTENGALCVTHFRLDTLTPPTCLTPVATCEILGNAWPSVLINNSSAQAFGAVDGCVRGCPVGSPIDHP